MSDNPGKLGVLISGSGTNLQAILDNCASGKLNAEVSVVISDKENAYGLERARNSGVETRHIPWRKKDKEGWESDAVMELKKYNVDLVCLAGFMRIVGTTLLEAFPGRILNIHPALLPSFPGLHGQKQAFDWGVKITGCTVHFVTPDLDMGPVIVQKAVRVLEDDTEDTLAARILEQEHIAYSEAINLVLSNRVQIAGRRVKILSAGDLSDHDPTE
jgi:phosphoribosylglycinamide formyltransferase-1